MGGKRGAGTKTRLTSLPQALSPAQNMAGGKKKNPPQKGDESYAERFDARYDDSPEVRALPPSLLTEWRANREALEGQNQLKVPNRLQNGLSSIQRTGLCFFWGTQNVLLPNGAGLPDPDWLARNQATKKSRGNTKNRCCIGGCGPLGRHGPVDCEFNIVHECNRNCMLTQSIVRMFFI